MMSKNKKEPLPNFYVADAYLRPPEILKSKKVSLIAFLDTFRTRKDNTHSVRLRVTYDRKPQYFTIPVNLTEISYKKIHQNIFDKKLKITKGEKESQKTIFYYLNTAFDVIADMPEFSFQEFRVELKKKISPNQYQEDDVFSLYHQIIEKNQNNGSFGNAENYSLSQKSLKKYLSEKRNVKKNTLFFHEITVTWLEGYESYFLNDLKRSRTTISMYLRALRAVFNTAIDKQVITKETYPFGRRKYQIPAAQGVKKALSQAQLKKLFESEPKTPEQKTAKDFWFFSYACSGMNLKDICLLKQSDLQSDRFIYYRQKTINTAKADLKPVVVFINDYTESIIEKYRNPNPAGEFVFQIISEKDPQADQYRKIKNFTRFINQHLKKLASGLGLPNDISTYWARHTFSTLAIRNGASMEFISEALNHHDIRTTKNYMAGFEDDFKKEFSKKLLDF